MNGETCYYEFVFKRGKTCSNIVIARQLDDLRNDLIMFMYKERALDFFNSLFISFFPSTCLWHKRNSKNEINQISSLFAFHPLTSL